MIRGSPGIHGCFREAVIRQRFRRVDWGFKIALAVAGVVGMAMVAPGLFTGNRDASDWGDEIKSIENQSKGKPSDDSEKLTDRE